MTSTTPRPPLPPFVLVHGAWGGAWIWRRVLGPLRAAGHDVHAVTLTGDGERAHLRQAGIGLAVHMADVVGVIDAEELDDFVLVGHSYAGIVITAVADRLLARPPGQGRRPRALVYVDAGVPLPGEAWGSAHPPELQAQRIATAAAHDNALPPVDPAVCGIEGPDRDWLLRRQVPHPFGMYREPLYFDAARWAALPRWFIDCNAPAFATIAEARKRVRQQAGWTVRELATGHYPMVTRPKELVQLLLEAAKE